MYIVKFTSDYGTLTFKVDAKDEHEAFEMAAEPLGQLKENDCDYEVKKEGDEEAQVFSTRKIFPIDLMPAQIAGLTNAFEIQDHGNYVMEVGGLAREAEARPGIHSETWVNRHKVLDEWLIARGAIDGEKIEIEGEPG